MTEEYFNASIHGTGFEGFVNYANILVDGWLASLFLLFVWIASVYVGSKSEWNMSSNVAFSFFLTLIGAMILRTFTIVNEIVIFIIIFGLGGSVLWSIIEKQ